MSNGLNPFLKSFTFCAENISQVDLQPFSHFYSLNWIRYPWACVPSVDSWIARQSSSLCLALLHCCIAFRGRMKSWEVTDGEKCCVCSCICSPSECLHRWDYIERQTQICRAMKALRRHKATPGTYLTVLVKRVLFFFFSSSILVSVCQGRFSMQQQTFMSYTPHTEYVVCMHWYKTDFFSSNC